jgi:hypothetical protein
VRSNSAQRLQAAFTAGQQQPARPASFEPVPAGNATSDVALCVSSKGGAALASQHHVHVISHGVDVNRCARPDAGAHTAPAHTAPPPLPRRPLQTTTATCGSGCCTTPPWACARCTCLTRRASLPWRGCWTTWWPRGWWAGVGVCACVHSPRGMVHVCVCVCACVCPHSPRCSPGCPPARLHACLPACLTAAPPHVAPAPTQVTYHYLTNTTKEVLLEPPPPGRSINWQRPVYSLCLERYGPRHTWMGGWLRRRGGFGKGRLHLRWRSRARLNVGCLAPAPTSPLLSSGPPPPKTRTPACSLF